MKFKLGLCQIAGSVDKEIAKQNAEKHVREAAENGGRKWQGLAKIRVLRK